jgi:hypothetical protein
METMLRDATRTAAAIQVLIEEYRSIFSSDEEAISLDDMGNADNDRRPVDTRILLPDLPNQSSELEGSFSDESVNNEEKKVLDNTIKKVWRYKCRVYFNVEVKGYH